jgi:hypothetical protein
MPGCFPPISLLNISVYRLQPRLFIDSPPYQVKKTHKPRYCEKEKDKANKRILRSLSFDNNDLVKPSCGTVALYGPFGFFLRYGGLSMNNLG